MSTSQDLIVALKAELRRAGITYGELAKELHIAESSVKRIFAKGDMPLSRIDAVLSVLKMDFADLAQLVVHAQPARKELTLEQERAVVADRKLLLVAICAMSQWTVDQMLTHYKLSPAEAVRYLAMLDRLGIIELRPMNRYRLKLDKGFRWRAQGPVMAYFRAHVVPDYFTGGFDGDGEMLMLVHGQISHSLAATFTERLQRLGQDFAQQHLADQKLPSDKKQAYTLIVGMRSWLFAAFRDFKRLPD